MKTASSTESPSSSSSFDTEVPEESKNTKPAKGCFDDFKDRLVESGAILEITGTDCCTPWKWFCGSLLVRTLQATVAIFGGTIASLANNSYYAIKGLATGNSYKNEAVSAQEFARRIFTFFTGTIKGSTEESSNKIKEELTQIDEENHDGTSL